MSEMTREKVERCKSMAHESTMIAGVNLRALCDLALSALTARSEGFREGVEAAARVCEGYAQEGERTGKEYVHETIAELVARLRALSPRETDASSPPPPERP